MKLLPVNVSRTFPEPWLRLVTELAVSTAGVFWLSNCGTTKAPRNKTICPVDASTAMPSGPHRLIFKSEG